MHPNCNPDKDRDKNCAHILKHELSVISNKHLSIPSMKQILQEFGFDKPASKFHNDIIIFTFSIFGKKWMEIKKFGPLVIFCVFAFAIGTTYSGWLE